MVTVTDPVEDQGGDPIRLASMPRRMEIELTSERSDGSWTWRAAGARQPKGVVDASVLPSQRRVGDVLRVEAEMEIDGITIVSVLPERGKEERSDLLALIPTERPFEAVTQQLAPKGRGDRPRRPRGDGERRDRRDDRRGDRREGGPGGKDSDRRGPSGQRREGSSDGDRRRRPRGDGDGPRRDRRPGFTPPPELPTRPKPRRLKPGRTHRNEVLAGLPEAHRPVAERVLQGGIPAVRQAVKEQNERLRAQGAEEIPAANLLSMAENLLPKLRVAEWLDRATAAKKDLELVDLRDLRSVVVASDDPVVTRDDSTRELAAELRAALVSRQEREHQQWLDDILAALAVGRVVRALRLSSQPPKAGVPFPAEVAQPLVAAASAALTPLEPADRWIALLEAAAFSPVHQAITVTSAPATLTEDLTKTVTRLAVLLPQVATALGIELPPPGTPAPKPLRPTRPNDPRRPAKANGSGRSEQDRSSGPKKDVSSKDSSKGDSSKDVSSQDAPEPGTSATEGEASSASNEATADVVEPPVGSEESVTTPEEAPTEAAPVEATAPEATADAMSSPEDSSDASEGAETTSDAEPDDTATA